MADEVVEGLDELLENFMRLIELGMGTPVTQAAEVGGAVLRAAAEENAPGPYIVSQVIRFDVGYAEVGIGPDKQHWYYRLFETGASPHVITPDTKKALFGGGLEHPLLQVNHPGFPARPFLRPALDSRKDVVLLAMGAEFWKHIEKAVA